MTEKSGSFAWTTRRCEKKSSAVPWNAHSWGLSPPPCIFLCLWFFLNMCQNESMFNFFPRAPKTKKALWAYKTTLWHEWILEEVLKVLLTRKAVKLTFCPYIGSLVHSLTKKKWPKSQLSGSFAWEPWFVFFWTCAHFIKGKVFIKPLIIGTVVCVRKSFVFI